MKFQTYLQRFFFSQKFTSLKTICNILISHRGTRNNNTKMRITSLHFISSLICARTSTKIEHHWRVRHSSSKSGVCTEQAENPLLATDNFMPVCMINVIKPWMSNEDAIKRDNARRPRSWRKILSLR